MRRKGIAWLLLLSLVPTTVAGALSAEDVRTLNVRIRRAFVADETLGGSVAVAREGEIVYTYAYGTAVLEGNVPVERDTLFRTASVTKLVTAVGAMKLVEQGMLDLDADIGRYLGYPVRNPRFPDDAITLRQLLCHTAGLKHNRDYAKKDTRERMALRDMLSDGPNVRDNYAARKPGAAYEYSNFGAGVVGSVMEAATGEGLSELMRTLVFEPLGMHAYYHPAQVSAGLPMAVAYYAESQRRAWDPYREAEHPPPSGADPEDHYDLAVGTLMISAPDLARILSLLCGDGSLDGVCILQPGTVRLMCTPQDGLGSVSGSCGYGLGVAIRPGLVKNRTLHGHQGTLYDLLCDAYCDRESGVAVAMLTNTTLGLRDENAYVLARTVMQAAFGAVLRE